MIKKLFPFLLVLTLIFGTMSSVMAAGSSKGSFSGGSRSYSSHSYSSGSNYSSSSGNTYRSGVRTPSSGISRPYSSYQQPYTQPRSSSWGSFFGGMAAGSLLTSMFHPFGGSHYYGGGYGIGGGGFSFFGLLFDLLLLYIAYRIVRRLFFRR